MTVDLAAWLREQIDADEASEWPHRPSCQMLTPVPAGFPGGSMSCDCDAADRWLREIEAKRRIMAIHAPREFSIFPQVCDGCGYGGYCDDPITEDINDCPELRALAAVYAESPGYRQEWTP